MIETLPLLTPDARRAARTLARCQERLARQRTRTARSVNPANLRFRVLERAFIGALSVIYLSSVALNAIRMFKGD